MYFWATVKWTSNSNNHHDPFSRAGLDIEEHGEAAYPVSAYKDHNLLEHLKELFEEIADPTAAAKRKRTKKQAIGNEEIKQKLFSIYLLI